MLVQAMVLPEGSLTVHDIVPAGSGFGEEVAATYAVNVVVPPRVGELEAEIVTVGTKFEIVSEAEFESPAR